MTQNEKRQARRIIRHLWEIQSRIELLSSELFDESASPEGEIDWPSLVDDMGRIQTDLTVPFELSFQGKEAYGPAK